MPTLFKISCPHCEARLSIKKEKLVGKKVPCPGCQEPLLIERPAADPAKTEEIPVAEAREDAEEELLDAELIEASPDEAPAAAPPPPPPPAAAEPPSPARKRTRGKRRAARPPVEAQTEELLDPSDIFMLDDVVEPEEVFEAEEVLEAEEVVEAAEVIEDSVGSDIWEMDDEVIESVPEAAATTPARPTGGRRGGGGKWKKITLIATLVVLGLGLIAGGTWYAMNRLNSLGDASMNLAWLPGDAELFIRLRVRATAASKLLQDLLKENPQVQEQLSKITGESEIALEDIDSVTVGVGNLGGVLENLESGPGGPATGSEASLSIVIRTLKDFDPQKVMAAVASASGEKTESAEHKGTSYFVESKKTPTADPGRQSFYFPDKRTIVVATESALKQMIDTGGKASERTDLEFLDGSQHLLLAFVPSDPGLIGKGTKAASGPAAMLGQAETVEALGQLVDDKLKAGSIGVSFSDGVSLQLRGVFADNSAALAMKNYLETEMSKARGQLKADKKKAGSADSAGSAGSSGSTGSTGSTGSAGGVTKEQGEEILAEIMETVRIEQRGTMTEWSVKVSSRAIDEIKQGVGSLLSLAGGPSGGPGLTGGSPGLDPGGSGKMPPFGVTSSSEIKLTLKGVSKEKLAGIGSDDEPLELRLENYLDGWLSKLKPGAMTFGSEKEGGNLVFEIVGFDDPAALAKAITFGKVTGVEGQAITVDFQGLP